MKAYTDLEQSKKLAEILPLESADMCRSNDGTAIKIDANPYSVRKVMWKDYEVIPCWSLAALFKLLPNCIEGAEPSLIKTFRDDYRIVYDIYGDEDITSEDHTNPIDACYEMIIKLHEQKLL